MAQSKPDKLSVDQVLKHIEKLSLSERIELRKKLEIGEATCESTSIETETWLEADLGEDLDSYSGLSMQAGNRVRYVKSVGFMITEEHA